MKSLNIPGSMRRLNQLDPDKTLFAFDYDGTLAPITGIPGGAKISDALNEDLRKLCKLVTVAVISGREVADLKRRLDFKPKFLIGNHGTEGIPGGRKFVREAKRISKLWNEQLAEAWVNFKPPNGVRLERKACSLTLHYRKTANRPRAKLALLNMAVHLDPQPRVVMGKCVINLVPDGLPHKGEALNALLQKTHLRHALYIGDDDTDEDVFRLHQKNIFGIRVGHNLRSAAEYYVDRPSDVAKLVHRLVRTYGA